MRRTALLLTVFVSLSLFLTACGKKDEPSEGKIDDADVTVTQTPDEPSETIPVTPELLDGTWVDENGFVCLLDIENDLFVDCYGAEFEIVAIEDGKIRLRDDQYRRLAMGGYALPIDGNLEISCEMTDDSLLILGHEAVRIDSEQGEQIAELMEENIAGRDFILVTSHVAFAEDMKTMTVYDLSTHYEMTYDIEFDGVRICSEAFDACFRMDDAGIWFNHLGASFPMDCNRCPVSDRWLFYDVGKDELTLLDFSGLFAYEENVLSGERERLYEQPPVYDISSYVPYLYYGGIDYTGINCEQFFDCSSYDLVNGYYEEMHQILRYDSVYAENLIARAEKMENGSGASSDYEIQFDGGRVCFELADDQWPSDIASVVECTSEIVPGYYESVRFEPLSETRTIRVGEAADGEIRIFFDYDGDVGENTAICFYSSESDIPFTILDTVFENGSAYCTVEHSGNYLLADAQVFTVLTEENFYDTDPMDTAWGNSSGAGDIASLVDLDYLRRSGYNFEVTTPEQLASVTYFVNAYPRDGSMPITIDLKSDLDLAAYEWAPIADDSDIYPRDDRSFNGAFHGNGYTISGLTIGPSDDNMRRAFFGNVREADINGLILEDATVCGISSALLAGTITDSSISDCDISGALPDSNNLGDRLVILSGTDDESLSLTNISYGIEISTGIEEGYIENTSAGQKGE